MGRPISKKMKSQADTFALIRFVAAIAVALFHYNKLTGGPHADTLLPFYSDLRLAYVHGGKLVELFFIISGFCFAAFYKDRIAQGGLRYLRFMTHRFCRVLPSYWLATFAIIILSIASKLLLDSTIAGAGRNFTEWKYLPLNLICLDFANPINGVAWFLAVNLICYGIFYWMFRVKRAGIELMVAAIIIASFSVYWLEGNAVQNIARGIASFGVGGV